ncbi:MAG: hypothetical protein K6T90_05980 [Leptolyngbyaceae cyanobacterium HOT.MB2.61]|nr:hypothetical protein [Leptolyngbyaceae cyanobacterium HOT.MB2.61]
MKNLTAEVRQKALDIANALLDGGYEKGRVIAVGTPSRPKWATASTPTQKPNCGYGLRVGNME